MLKLLGKDRKPLGLLARAKDIVFEEDLKTGLTNLSFLYPITDALANKIEGETYIRTTEYEFVVKEVNKKSNEWFDVVCKPNIETLLGKPHLKFEGLESTAANIIRLALGVDTGWIVEEKEPMDKRRTIRKETANTYEIIQEVAKVFMIEMEFDTLRKQIRLYNKRGSNKGAFFTNQLNLKSLEEQTNTYDFITKLVPIGKDDLRITEVNDGKDYVENFQHSKKVIAQYWVDKRYTNAESLRADAIAKLDELSKPMRSFSANLYMFDKDIKIGDTITLIDNIKGIKEQQRVVKIKSYPLSPEKDTVEIANKLMSFSEIQKQLQDSASTLDDITTDSGAVDGSKIEGLPEVNTEIPDGSITEDKLQDGAVSADKIQAGTITADKIQAGTITADKIEAGSITANEIKAGTITATEIETGMIKANSAIIEDAAITRAKIAEAAIGNAQIEDASIDNAKIDKLAVGSAQIQDLAVGTAQIADAAITTAKIGKLAVDNANIKDATIESAKIKDLNADKITAGDIDADRIKTNVITAINASIGKIDADKIVVGDIDAGNITTGSLDAEIIKSTVIEAINASIGKATIDSAKIGDLEADKIVSGDISADRMSTNAIKAINATIGSATIDSAKIGEIDAGKITTGTLDADRIKAGSISANKLSADAINAASVKASEVVADKIKSGDIKVGNANILDGTINGAKITKATIGNAQISEAFIADGFIKNLNAEKITSGTLDASKVRVMSKDGSLFIRDNTIQITDNQKPAKVRVQVGKDSRGEYGILVMNKAGEAIFDSDKGVLSDKGLNNNVVSTDKIRDDAVDSNKLNVEEIFVSGNAFMNRLDAVEIKAQNITTGTISNDRLDLKGLISFEMLDKDLNPVFDVKGNKTYINGGAIAANSITADKIQINGLSVINNKKEVSFAVSQDGNVSVNGLLQSGNFDIDKHTGYKISTDGKAILNQAEIRGDVILPNAGITNSGIGGANPVRFWAGAGYDNRNTAPFKVYQNGDVFANNVSLNGILYGSLNDGTLHIKDSALVINNSREALLDDGTVAFIEPRATQEYVRLSAGQCSLNTNLALGNNNVQFSNDNNSLDIRNTKVNIEGRLLTTELNPRGGVVLHTKDGGAHEFKSSTYQGYLGALCINSTGSKGSEADYVFLRKDGAENCQVKVEGDLTINNKLNSAKNKIELKADANGWGFYSY